MNGKKKINKECKMNKYLIKLANHLDKKGLHKEADYVDWIIKNSRMNIQKGIMQACPPIPNDIVFEFYLLYQKSIETNDKNNKLILIKKPDEDRPEYGGIHEFSTLEDLNHFLNEVKNDEETLSDYFYDNQISEECIAEEIYKDVKIDVGIIFADDNKGSIMAKKLYEYSKEDNRVSKK